MKQLTIFLNRQFVVMKKTYLQYSLFSLFLFITVILGTNKDVFCTYEATKSCIFAMVMAAVWCGLFNSLCQFHEESVFVLHDIREQLYSPFMYVISNVIIQCSLAILQSLIATFAFHTFNYDKSGLLLRNSTLEIFVTLFLIIFGAAGLGLLVSTLITLRTAIGFVPVLLIIQLLFSKGIFEVNKRLDPITNFVLAKYGMASMGSILNINTIEPCILKEHPELRDMVPYSSNRLFDHSADYLARCWYHLAILSLIPIVLSIAVISYKAYKKTDS